MGKWYNNYVEGILGLFVGEGISYYTYLAIVLSEIFYIWRFLPQNAMAFTILLAANCIIIGFFGLLKRLCAFSVKERAVAKIYWIALVITFIAGCFVDLLQNLVLWFLPVIFTAIWVLLREIQMLKFATSNLGVLKVITKIFSLHLTWILLLIFVSVSPLIILMYVVSLVFEARFLIFLIPFVFAIILPFITWFEEFFVNQNIFQIGYKVIFSKKVEKLLKELNVSAEVFWCEEFIVAVCKLEEEIKFQPADAWYEFAKEVKRIQDNLTESKKHN